MLTEGGYFLITYLMAVRNVALLVLQDGHGKILLQHRSHDAKRLPNHWAFFGGGIEAGETPEMAVRREILEELEYPVTDPKLIHVQSYIWRNDTNTKYIFTELIDPAKPLIQHEGQGLGWWKFNELDKLLIVDHDREALRSIEKFFGSKEMGPEK